jgi:hypothetical protein
MESGVNASWQSPPSWKVKATLSAPFSGSSGREGVACDATGAPKTNTHPIRHNQNRIPNKLSHLIAD